MARSFMVGSNQLCFLAAELWTHDSVRVWQSVGWTFESLRLTELPRPLPRAPKRRLYSKHRTLGGQTPASGSEKREGSKEVF